MEGLIFGGAYLWREICVSKSIGLALQLKVKLPYLLCFTLCLRAISKYKPPGGLYLESRFNGGFFALRVWGGGGLYLEGLIFGILRYLLAVLAKTPAAYILMYCNAFSTTFTAIRCFQLRKNVLRLDATSYQSSHRTVQHLCL